VHLVYQRVVNGTSGPVIYRQVGASALSPEENVAPTVARARLSVATNPSGDVVVAFTDVSTAGPGDSFVRSRVRSAATTAFAEAQDIVSMPFGLLPPAAGSSRVLFDDDGKVNAAIFLAYSKFHAVPAFGIRTGATYETRPIERSDQVGRVSGQSIGLALTGVVKHAMYFVNEVNVRSPELRLATWVVLADSLTFPTFTTLLSAMEVAPSAEGAPRHALALASDKFGLLHAAIVVPTSASLCKVEYRRQKRVAGQVSWLVDVVEEGLPCDDTGDVNVDIAIDASARPHLLYSAMNPVRLVYATRFDR
jgi:hypothetical protein